MTDKSPYLPAPIPTDGLENEDINETIVQDPDGTSTLAGRTVETVLVDATDSRRFLRTQTILRTTDGRLIRDPNAQGLFTCTRCHRGTLASGAVGTCIVCQDVLCRKRCAIVRRNQWWCRPCYTRQRITELIQEIFRWR
ncbi:MAG: hypothetical protein ACHREM_11970 [Polyangiales bacterium]